MYLIIISKNGQRESILVTGRNMKRFGFTNFSAAACPGHAGGRPISELSLKNQKKKKKNSKEFGKTGYMKCAKFNADSESENHFQFALFRSELCSKNW